MMIPSLSTDPTDHAAAEPKTKANRKFAAVFLILEVAIVVLYGVGVRYSDELFHTDQSENIAMYPLFQDIHVMMFIGFGYLMTFLYKYMFGAVCLTMLIAVAVIQWYILVQGFLWNLFQGSMNFIGVDLVSLVTADFAVAAVLITFGALIGKVSPLQMLVIAHLEILFYTVNEQIGIHLIKQADVGGSMTIHVFGAYFGLAASWVLTPKPSMTSKNNGTAYTTDVFSLIGTLFLWLFWPSFNSATAGAAQQRAIVNTVIALVGSSIGTFIASNLLRKRFAPVDIQNATLAGGVAMGSIANFAVQPPGALLVGLVAGILSTLGYVKIQPWLQARANLHDTCGVNNLHGMPGLLSGVLSILYALFVTPENYKCRGGDALDGECQIHIIFPGFLGPGGSGSPASPQGLAARQAEFLFCTLGMALASGLLVGGIAKYIEPVADAFFDDTVYFEVPQDVEAPLTGHLSSALDRPPLPRPASAGAFDDSPRGYTPGNSVHSKSNIAAAAPIAE